MGREDEIAAMTPAERKVLENRLRRSAERQELRIVKSRRRDPRARDFGRYLIVDPFTNAVVYPGENVTLAEVENVLLTREPGDDWFRAPLCPECGQPTQSLLWSVRGATVYDRQCGDCGHSFRAAEPAEDDDA